MKKITKITILIIVFVFMIAMSTTVFADGQLDLGTITGNTNDEPVEDLSNSINAGTTGNTSTPESTTPENTTPENEVTDTTPSTTTNTNPNKNTSTYEESDLPYAGPAESILMVSAFLVCAIIGVYTFIKLSDYSNV